MNQWTRRQAGDPDWIYRRFQRLTDLSILGLTLDVFSPMQLIALPVLRNAGMLGLCARPSRSIALDKADLSREATVLLGNETTLHSSLRSEGRSRKCVLSVRSLVWAR